MSKSLSLIFILCIIFFCTPQYTLANIASKYEGNFYIYTYQYYTSNNTEIIKNGKANIIICDCKNSLKILNKLEKNKITGMQICTTGNSQTIKNFIKRTKTNIKYSEKVQNIEFFYGFSSLFVDYTIFNNEKINIQISLENNKLNIGVPLILGSV